MTNLIYIKPSYRPRNENISSTLLNNQNTRQKISESYSKNNSNFKIENLERIFNISAVALSVYKTISKKKKLNKKELDREQFCNRFFENYKIRKKTNNCKNREMVNDCNNPEIVNPPLDSNKNLNSEN